MVGNGSEVSIKKELSMPFPHAQIEPERIAERLAALPGIDRVREAARGIRAYLVGGAVRDLLLGRPRTDIDIAVEDGVGELAERLGGEVRAHERFGTAIVRVDGLEVDLATTRTEEYAHPGALPEVRASSLAEDLSRRDFTLNAMATPLAGEPELIDFHGGLEDLRLGRLRVLHPRSFEDDPTRALRAARYAARYGFALEPATAELLRQAELSTVSRDRAEAELRKLAAEPEARRGFELLGEWGLLELPPGALELAGAVGELTAGEPWAGIAPRADAVLAAALGRGLSEAGRLASGEPASASEAVDRARGRCGVELALARALGAKWLDRYVAEWRNVRLEIGGSDLIAKGIAEGPAVGRGLREALRAKLDGETHGREEELRAALAAARENDHQE
jgi:tRNA nucleotidyltransferase (CCA-adding enzyme)